MGARGVNDSGYGTVCNSVLPRFLLPPGFARVVHGSSQIARSQPLGVFGTRADHTD
jgi:hypothetical protein